MKKYTFFILLFLVINACVIGQSAFYGEWHMQELAIETLKEKEVNTNEMIREKGTFWIMKFNEDGSFYQTTNDNAREETVEMVGEWKTEPNELLTIFIHRDGEKLPLQFFYKFKEDKMILERHNQFRTLKVITVFKKID